MPSLAEQAVHGRRRRVARAGRRRSRRPSAGSEPASARRSGRRRRRRSPPRRTPWFRSSCDHVPSLRRSRSGWQTLLPVWQTERHGRRPRPGPHAVGPAAARAAPAARDHAGRPLGDDRHLGQHAVPAGVRRRAGRPSSCCCRWPGRYGVTARRAGRRAADRRPAHAPPAGHAPRHDDAAADPPRRRHPGVQAGHPGRGRAAQPELQDPRGLRVALRARRHGCGCVLGEHDLVLAAGEAAEFDTRVPHWFGAADDRGRSSSSACSASRASAHT